MDEAVRIPDVEVLIGAASNDVAIFCFYRREDIHQGYDVVFGVHAKNERPALRQILLDCIKALDTEDWVTVDELGSLGDAPQGEPPF